MLVWVVLALLVALWVYVELAPSDVDPNVIKSQGVPSSTHLPGESAIYRSPANPPVAPLLDMPKFTACQLYDPEKLRISCVSELSRIADVDLPELIGAFQAALPPSPDVVITDLGATPHFLALFLAVAFLGGIVEVVDDIPEKAPLFVSRSRIGVSCNGTFTSLTSSQPVKISQCSPNNPVLRNKDTQITHRELGTAIAAQLVMPGSQRWTSKDRVLMFTHPVTPFVIVEMLTAISAGSSLTLIEPGPLLHPFASLEVSRPSIVVSEDMTLRTLVRHMDDWNFFAWIKHGWKRLRLAKGALPSATIPQFDGVRLIHTETGPDPYDWLDNGEVANLRVLCGSQVLRSLTTGGLALTETVPGDYRTGKSTLLGPPVAGVELKTHGGHLYSRSCSNPEWVNTGIDSTMRSDGCVWTPLQRHIVSEKYFYTGELH